MTLIVHFASISTLRQDEICKLQVEDVNFTKLEMLVRDRKDPEEKLNNNSLVPILKPMYEILKQAIGDRKAGPVFIWTLKKTGELRETYADSVRANFDRACVALRIHDLHFHDLRHTAITNLFAIGLQIQEVSLFSGHKDWTNLKRYTHVSPGDVQRSIARLQFLEEQSKIAKYEKSNGVDEVSSAFFDRLDSTLGESSWAWFGAGLIADSISNTGQELLQ